MKSVLRHRIALAPSRFARVFVIASHGATVILLALLPIAPGWRIVSAFVVLACALATILRLRGGPTAIVVGLDRRIIVVTGARPAVAGAIRAATVVGSRFASIVWRPDGLRRWRPSRHLLVTTDMVNADAHRRMRVLLRFGRPASEIAEMNVGINASDEKGGDVAKR